jgi:hypothetical protein
VVLLDVSPGMHPYLPVASKCIATLVHRKASHSVLFMVVDIIFLCNYRRLPPHVGISSLLRKVGFTCPPITEDWLLQFEVVPSNDENGCVYAALAK